jgi:hypothetical protein
MGGVLVTESQVSPTADVEIRLEDKGDKVRVVLRAGHDTIPVAGAPFDLPPPPPTQDAWRKLYDGRALLSQFDAAAEDLRSWLLGGHFGDKLGEVLQDREDRSTRLVFRLTGEDLVSLPLELLRSPVSADPLGLDQRVASVVYLPPREPVSEARRETVATALRVLIVRSNPRRLGGFVPPALPIREKLLALDDAIGLVEVDLLSSEGSGDPIIGQPLYDDLRTALKRQYDILVYLGHGNVYNQTSVLEFEDPEDRDSDSVDSVRLVSILRENPVPVVLLVGCVTAVEAIRDRLDGDETRVARLSQGSRNIARSLVEAEVGVEVAVGMRSQLEASAAEVFLSTFFKSFLNHQPGHVEAALQATRRELAVRNPNRITWLAPLAYRAQGSEPMFDVLAQMVAGQRLDPSQALLDVFVLDQTNVRAVAQGVNFPGEKKTEVGELGEQLLWDTVNVLEKWVRLNRLTERAQFEVLGKLLYRLLFGDKLGQFFDNIYSQKPKARRLLVRLSFPKQARELAELPWEYLYAADQQPGFFFASYGSNVSLVLSRFDPNARRLRVDPSGKLPDTGNMRILAVVGPLTGPKSSDEIFTAFDKLAEGHSIVIERLANPTLAQLGERIDQWKPHIVHFVGQGLRPQGDEQRIQLTRPYPGSEFVGALVSSEWKPRVVFLQLTGRHNAPADFARLAPTLVENEVHAVVAMRYPITIEVARWFCEAFYPALAGAERIDVAVQRGLDRMLRKNERLDRLFGTPVFYIQWPNQIMQLEPPLSEPSLTQSTPKTKGASPATEAGAAQPAPSGPARRAAPNYTEPKPASTQ